MNQDLERTEELLGKSGKKAKKKTGIIIIAIAAIIAAGIGVFIGVSGSNSNQVNEKLKIADKLLLEGKYEQAITAYNEVIKIDDKNAKAYEGLGDSYTKSNQYKKAVKPYKEAVKNAEGKDKDKVADKVVTTAINNNDEKTAKEVLELRNKDKSDKEKKKLDDYMEDRKAYQNVLNTLYDENKFEIDGETITPFFYDNEFKSGELDFSENRFAMADIDNDGKNELIFEANTAMSNYVGTYILKYDERTKELRNMVQFYKPVFYSNSMIKAAHYKIPDIKDGFTYGEYNAKEDKWSKYVVIKHLSENNSTAFGEEFSEEEDKNGNGIIYDISILTEEGEKREKWLDDDEFKAWEEKTFDSTELKIDYKAFTKENINIITELSSSSTSKVVKIQEKLYVKVNDQQCVDNYYAESKDGKTVWKYTTEKFPPAQIQHSFHLLTQKYVYINDGGIITRLDRETGKELAKSKKEKLHPGEMATDGENIYVSNVFGEISVSKFDENLKQVWDTAVDGEFQEIKADKNKVTIKTWLPENDKIIETTLDPKTGEKL